MLLLIPLGGLLWERGGRKLLMTVYALTVCLGLLGLVFHSEGHLVQRLLEFFSVWISSPQAGASIKALRPPLLAPCAFLGLGSIGILFCIQAK
jgi:hypothetical protein